jgi:hypothetical protein
MTYRFEQFKTEITDPIVIVDMTNITDNTIESMLTIGVTLQTPNAKMYGVSLDKIPYVKTWSDSQIEGLVMERLKDFAI